MSAAIALLGALRGAFGFGCWVAPQLTRQLFDLGGSAQTTDILMTRAFGARDFALGVALLVPHKDVSIRTVLTLGILVDALDTAASCIAYSQGGLSVFGFISAGAAAAAFVGLGYVGLQSLSERKAS